MKKSLLRILRCPVCKAAGFKPVVTAERYNEWREGTLECDNCHTKHKLDSGIVDLLFSPSDEIKKEQKASAEEVRIKTEGGEKYRIDSDSIEQFSDTFLSLPKGNNSSFFKNNGSFQNFAEGAHRFFEFVDKWPVSGGARVLEVGAGFCWASREFVKRGAEVVAVEITEYLKVADLYIRENLFFERVYADMNNLPFLDNSFDIIFSAATVHHSSDLLKTFGEFYRVLKKGGKVILLNECFVGIFEKPQVHPEDFGYNDHYYTIPEWKASIKESGFKDVKVTYLSFFKDYIERKKVRGIKKNLKLYLAAWAAENQIVDGLVSYITMPYRFFFRPKSLLIEATK